MGGLWWFTGSGRRLLIELRGVVGGGAVDALPEVVAAAVLDAVAPGGVLVRVERMAGSFSNHTDLVVAEASGGVDLRLVVRRYAEFGDYDRGEKARREYQTLQLLRRHGIPVPEPVLLDDTGAVLGAPGIVTRYAERDLVLSPLPETAARARSLATMLAQIHGVPCDPARCGFLLDADAEATWFLQGGTVPGWMAAHPDGPTVWHAVRHRWHQPRLTAPGLVHLDYWPGNVLWRGTEVGAVVDWEEAAQGHPAIDVAYCRMDLWLSGTADAAETFLLADQDRGAPRLFPGA